MIALSVSLTDLSPIGRCALKMLTNDKIVSTALVSSIAFTAGTSLCVFASLRAIRIQGTFKLNFSMQKLIVFGDRMVPLWSQAQYFSDQIGTYALQL